MILLFYQLDDFLERKKHSHKKEKQLIINKIQMENVPSIIDHQ